MPRGVICLLSALEYYELTTFNPSEVYVAIPHADKPPKIAYPPVKAFFFRARFYTPGIVNVRTKQGNLQPDFSKVLMQVRKFIEPAINPIKPEAAWNPAMWRWE